VLLGNAAMKRLPVLDRPLLLELLTAGLSEAELDRRAEAQDVERILARVFGAAVPAIADLGLPADASVRALYAAIAETDLFRTACGRISASYGW
jgi:hypothetical protein